ncbi:MAG: methionine--tRNA ligase [Parcubacteria group bacterium]|nr:methionine--tRNA ligase [Parcubacteria group bacterium]
MFMKKVFYQTTTLPYVNAKPHIGFALEIIQADARARFERLLGREVFFNTGTDEHGLKIFNAAQEVGKKPQEYVDELAPKFDELKKALNLSYDNFIRTTDENHIKATEKLWEICQEKGDIYKKNYKGLYCISCERFIKEDECKNNRCPNHSTKNLEEVEEENYFFRFSKYEKELLEYLKNPKVITPKWRREEAINFVKSGLEDFSVSRIKEKMPWGVPVPGDENHVMYVWFDALTNYISTLGWPDDKDGNFQKFWNDGQTIQFAGKDQVRFQSLMWQAMLISAGIKTTDEIFYHGFITVKGEKISKSIGNIVDPFEIVEKFGTDTLRYHLLRHVSPVEDSNFSEEILLESYNANLANGLGNLFSRIMKMYVDYGVEIVLPKKEEILKGADFDKLRIHIDNFEFNKALDYIWREIGILDAHIQETEPFKLIKKDEKKAKEIVAYLATRLYEIATLLKPFLPETAEIISKGIEGKVIPKPLFLRK